MSEEFLNDPETTYPFTIDPTISNGASYVSDTYVSEAEPSKSFGSVDHLRFGKTGNSLLFTLIRFDSLMESIVPIAAINSASMKFTFRSGQTTGSTGALWRITEYWAENITCNNRPSVASWQANDATSAPNKVNGYIDNYTFNVKTLIQDWIGGDYPYYGVYLTYTQHSVPDYNSVVSSDGEAHRAPVLTVNYGVRSPLPSGIKNNTIYFIRNYNSDKYLQAGNDRETLRQQAFSGDTNQQWKLVHHGSGWFSFVPMSNSSLRLDVPNRDDINGLDLWACGNNNTDAQRFRIIANGDGTYPIQPKTSYYSDTKPGCSTNMVLEVTNSSTVNGAVVQIWEYKGRDTMKWVFEEASTVGNGGPYTEHTSSSYNCMSYALKYYQSWLTPTGYELFHTQIGVGNRLDGGRRRVKKYLWSFLRTAPAGQVRL